MKVAVFGSCMSNLTMSRLNNIYGYEQTHSIHHNRSDVFIKYHIEKNSMIPLEKLERELLPKNQSDLEARNILRNQYSEHLGLFQLESSRHKYGNFIDFAHEGRWDLILLDNFMDIAAKLMFNVIDDPYQEKPLFLNPHFYQNEAEISRQYHHTPFLSAQESLNNWITICQWLHKLQPQAKIFFIPYHSCSSTENEERYNRITGFHNLLGELKTSTNINIVPPLDVHPALTKGQVDWPHFDDRIYNALAGYIYLLI